MATAFSFDNCTAIITGASSGLGAEFARQLARKASSLVLVARRGEALKDVKAGLLTDHPALTVHLCVADLSTEDGRARLISEVDGLRLKPNLLINNAGVGDYGTFATADVGRLREQIDLNITAVVLVTRAMIPRFEATKAHPAGLLNVSSLAGNLPMPELAVYAASKAFVTSFSEALRVELMDQHIIVSAVCPGPTPTNFGRNARRALGADTNRSGQELLRVPPEWVVKRGLRALATGQPCVFPGFGVAVAGPLFRVMPRALMRWLLERRHRPSS